MVGRHQWHGPVSFSVLRSKFETIGSPNKFNTLAEKTCTLSLCGTLRAGIFKIISLITNSVGTIE